MILFSFSCSNNREKRPQEEIRSAAAYDSLRKFDSLVNQYKISSPLIARGFAEDALKMVSAGGDERFNARVYLMAGISCQLDYPDTAYRYYRLAQQSALKAGYDSIRPRILYNMAMLYEIAYNYKDALNLLDSAQKMANKLHDLVSVSNCLNSMGNIEAVLEHVERAVTFFTQALKVAEEGKIPVQTGVALGSIARFEKDPVKRHIMQERALRILQKQPGTMEQTGYLLVNIGDDLQDPDSAISYYKQAIDIGNRGHLAEIEIAALNNMAYSYAEKTDYPQALAIISKRAIPLALQEQKTAWLSTLYDTYADLLNQVGKSGQAYLFQKKALEASTQAIGEHAASQVRLLNTLIQVRSKEVRILEQDNMINLQSKKVLRLYYIVIGLAAIVVLVFLILRLFIQRKNLQIQRQEIESAKTMANLEEQEREHLSMQLHDLIRPVSGAMMSQIGRTKFSDPAIKSEMVGLLEKISGSLRQLSHRMNPVMRNKLTLPELTKGIKQDFELSSDLSIKITLFPTDLKLSPSCSNHLYFILLELLANADKHIGRGVVEISVSAEFDNLYIIYSDNGGGFDPAIAAESGLGLTLIRKRVAILGGTTSLTTGVGKGTNWIISLPAVGNVIAG